MKRDMLKYGRGYDITEERLRLIVAAEAGEQIPADAVMNVDWNPQTGTLFVGFHKIVPVLDPRDLGDLRVFGQGAPIPTLTLKVDDEPR